VADFGGAQEFTTWDGEPVSRERPHQATVVVASRYIAASPALRVMLARAGLFIFFASAIWALLPRLRARLSADALLAAGSAGPAAVMLLLAYAHVTAVAAVALVVGGGCWVLALSTRRKPVLRPRPRAPHGQGISPPRDGCPSGPVWTAVAGAARRGWVLLIVSGC
jgi:Transmembrane secretion effector